MIDTICAACGMPGHRYGRNEGMDRFNPQACINGLLARLQDAERRIAEADNINWCEVHDFVFTAPEHFYRCSVGDKRDEDCHMVVRPLLKPVETRKDADPSGASPVS